MMILPEAILNEEWNKKLTNLFVDSSRYVMACLMMIYACLDFRYFGVDEERKRKLCNWQRVLQFLIHFLAYAVIYMKTEDLRMITFYAAQVFFFMIYMTVYQVFYKQGSRFLLNHVCMLLSVGFIVLARLSLERAMRQFGIAVISACFTCLVPVLVKRFKHLQKLTLVYAVVGLVLLGVVFLAGNTSFGAQLSIEVGGVSVQPSEFVKLTFVFFIAGMLERSTGFKQVVITTILAAMHVVILVLSNDLGSGLIFFITYLFMLFVATSNWFYLGAGMLSGCGAAIAAYRLFAHVQRRVAAWHDPWSDIDNRGYQIAQSLFAIGSGSWFGMGLYQGMPKKIPVVEKDFVFAAISEEMGAVFAMCLILICFACFVQFMVIAWKWRNLFLKLVALGMGMVYITQVFLCVGGVIKFIPSTGVTLPFVSYGGSSVLSSFLMFGVLQGIYLTAEEGED